MARRCEITGKQTAFGHRKKHRRGSSGGGGVWRFKAPKSKRTWKPNLRKVKLEVNGITKRVKISMKAYKKLRKEQEQEAHQN